MRINLKQYSLMLLISLASGLTACSQQAGLDGMDDYGSLAYQNQNLSNQSLTLYASTTQVGYGESMNFAAAGGMAPYTYDIVGGADLGTIDEFTGLFKAAAKAGQVTVQVQDTMGRSAIGFVTVYANGPGSSGYSYKAGLMKIEANANCSSNTSSVGVVGVGYMTKQVCAGKDNVSATTQVYQDVTVTAAGLHVYGPSCPSGYSAIASIPDCGGGSCYGEQLVCAKIAAASVASSYLTNFFVSQAGAHASSGVSCPTGSSVAGSTVDCGGGVCSGFQTFCKTF